MLPQLATLTVKDRAGDAVSALALVELGQRAPALGFVIDLCQRVQGLVDAAELCEGLGQSGRALAHLERAHDALCRHPAKLERAGQAQHVVPMWLDFLQVDIVSGYRIEHAVVGLRVDPPKARTADIGQARAESVAKQAEQPENHVAVRACVRHDLRRLKVRLLFQDYGQQDQAVAQRARHRDAIQSGKLVRY